MPAGRRLYLRGGARRNARRLRTGQPLRGAAAAEGDRGAPGAAEGHPLSRGDRVCRRGQHHQPGRARAGLPAGDQLQGRGRGEGRPDPLHHRAGTVQAEARAGAGRRGRRAGDGETDGGGLRAPDRPVEPPGLHQGRARQCHGQQGHGGGEVEAGRGRDQGGRAQPRLHRGEGALRRDRDGAQGVAGRAGGSQWPDPARHHRADQPGLCELHHQRAGSSQDPRGDAPPRRQQAGSGVDSDRGRAAERHRLSVSRHARLRVTQCRLGDRDARRARHHAEPDRRAGAGLFRARARRVGRAEFIAGAGCRARQRPGRALPPDRQQGQRGGAAQGHDRPQGRRPARDRKRDRTPGIASSSPASCGRYRARRSTRRCRPSQRRPRPPPAPPSSGRRP